MASFQVADGLATAIYNKIKNTTYNHILLVICGNEQPRTNIKYQKMIWQNYI